MASSSPHNPPLSDDGASVIMPWLPRRTPLKYVAEALASIKETIPHEIIVVTDECSVRNERALRSVVDEVRPDTIVVPHREHRGAPFRRNEGWALARYTYRFFFDSDDLLTEGAIGLLHEQARRSGGLVVFANCIAMDARRTWMEVDGTIFTDAHVISRRQTSGFHQLFRQTGKPPPFLVYSTSPALVHVNAFPEGVPPFDESLSMAEMTEHHFTMLDDVSAPHISFAHRLSLHMLWRAGEHNSSQIHRAEHQRQRALVLSKRAGLPLQPAGRFRPTGAQAFLPPVNAGGNALTDEFVLPDLAFGPTVHADSPSVPTAYDPGKRQPPVNLVLVDADNIPSELPTSHPGHPLRVLLESLGAASVIDFRVSILSEVRPEILDLLQSLGVVAADRTRSFWTQVKEIRESEVQSRASTRGRLSLLLDAWTGGFDLGARSETSAYRSNLSKEIRAAKTIDRSPGMGTLVVIASRHVCETVRKMHGIPTDDARPDNVYARHYTRQTITTIEGAPAYTLAPRFTHVREYTRTQGLFPHTAPWKSLHAPEPVKNERPHDAPLMPKSDFATLSTLAHVYEGRPTQVLQINTRLPVTIVWGSMLDGLKLRTLAEQHRGFSPDVFDDLNADEATAKHLADRLREIYPGIDVRLRRSSEMSMADIASGNTILLGGELSNRLICNMSKQLQFPTSIRRDGATGKHDLKFVLDHDGERRELSLRFANDRLVEDVARVTIGANPHNSNATLAILGGLRSFGTDAAVQAATGAATNLRFLKDVMRDASSSGHTACTMFFRVPVWPMDMDRLQSATPAEHFRNTKAGTPRLDISAEACFTAPTLFGPLGRARSIRL